MQKKTYRSGVTCRCSVFISPSILLFLVPKRSHFYLGNLSQTRLSNSSLGDSHRLLYIHDGCESGRSKHCQGRRIPTCRTVRTRAHRMRHYHVDMSSNKWITACKVWLIPCHVILKFVILAKGDTKAKKMRQIYQDIRDFLKKNLLKQRKIYQFCAPLCIML